MERDIDLLRKILMDAHSEERGLVYIKKAVGKRPLDEIKRDHHIELLCDEGWMAHVNDTACRITSAGYDLIEHIKDDGGWEWAKGRLAELGRIVTLANLADLIERHF